MQSQSFASLLDTLATTIQEVAAAARAQDALDLPPVLTTRDLARLEGQSVTTIWRRAHQGEAGGLPSPIDPPRAGQPLRWYREVYLAHRRRKAQAVAGG